MGSPVTRSSGGALLVPVLSRWQSGVLAAYMALMWYFTVHYYSWWLKADKPATFTVTLLLGFATDIYHTVVLCLLMPLLYCRALKLNPALPPPKGLRVAMIVTKVPSEPLEMLAVTLKGMLKQDYPFPYDVWLADEAPDEATKAWCKDHGVQISSRQGVAEYHKPEWPRRTRCKEGNLAFFYDHWGYQQYDVVCQFDADHVPQPNYLCKVLPAFRDPKVGYAAMPSINDSNMAGSWSARGRCYIEGHQHGLWGCASNYDWLPFAIGSHYAVRTQALKEAGGIGPELDEDVSTSYIITAAGYKGVFCIDAMASGEGPSTFEVAMYQEYQWARSAMVLLVRHTAPYWPGLSWRQKLKLTWAYGYWIYITLAVLSGYVWLLDATFAPPHTATSVLAFGFAAQVRAAPIKLLLYLLQLWIISQGWSRPRNVPALHWESMLYRMASAWWVAKGTVHGLLGGLFGIRFNIKVTPKSKSGGQPMPLSCLMPSLSIAAYALVVAVMRGGHLLMAGVVVSSLVLSWLLLLLHLNENPSGHKLQGSLEWRQLRLLLPLLLTGAAVGHCYSGCYSGPLFRMMMFHNLPIPFKEFLYPLLGLTTVDARAAAGTATAGFDVNVSHKIAPELSGYLLMPSQDTCGLFVSTLVSATVALFVVALLRPKSVTVPATAPRESVAERVDGALLN